MPSYSSNPLAGKKYIWKSVVIVLVGNWLFWPCAGAILRAGNTGFAESRWRMLDVSFIRKHAANQRYLNWAEDEYMKFFKQLSTDSDMIGTWIHTGNFFATCGRLRIPIEGRMIAGENRRPHVWVYKTPEFTTHFIGVPWDLPPPQYSPQVVLLDHFGPDVRYGRTNIKELVPPLEMETHWW